MVKVSVYNTKAEEIGQMELNEDIFGVEVNENLVHDAVVNQLANKRQGTKSALTRAEVRGGGRKPFKQKGTGRARAGSRTQPNWIGGGVVFAPKPRDYSYKMNKKQKRIALKSVLTSRILENKFIVIGEFNMDTVKTKNMQEILNNFKLNKALVVLEGQNKNNKNIVLSSRNISGVKTASVNTINVYDILKYDTFVVTKDALEKMQEVYV